MADPNRMDQSVVTNDDDQEILGLAEQFAVTKSQSTDQRMRMKETKDRVFDYLTQTGQEELKVGNTLFKLVEKPGPVKQQDVLDHTLKTNYAFTDDDLDELEELMKAAKQELAEPRQTLSVRTVKPKQRKRRHDDEPDDDDDDNDGIDPAPMADDPDVAADESKVITVSNATSYAASIQPITATTTTLQPLLPPSKPMAWSAPPPSEANPTENRPESGRMSINETDGKTAWTGPMFQVHTADGGTRMMPLFSHEFIRANRLAGYSSAAVGLPPLPVAVLPPVPDSGIPLPTDLPTMPTTIPNQPAKTKRPPAPKSSGRPVPPTTTIRRQKPSINKRSPKNQTVYDRIMDVDKADAVMANGPTPPSDPNAVVRVQNALRRLMASSSSS